MSEKSSPSPPAPRPFGARGEASPVLRSASDEGGGEEGLFSRMLSNFQLRSEKCTWKRYFPHSLKKGRKT